MNTISKVIGWVGFLLTATILVACSDGGGGGDNYNSKVDPPLESSITVVPSLGMITDATVNIYKSDGTSLIDSGNLGSDGQFTITITGYSGPIIIEVAGNADAKYYDEALGSWIDYPSGTSIHAMAPTSSGSFAVTMLTELAFQNAVINSNFPISAATVIQLNEYIRSWLIPEINNLLATPMLFDSNITQGSMENEVAGRYALRLAGLANLGSMQPAPTLAVLLALIEDTKDGVIDGKNGLLTVDAPYSDFWVQMSTLLSALASSYGTPDLITAVASYPRVPIAAIANNAAQNLTVGTPMPSLTPLNVSGGATPYTFSYTGTLPTGLSFVTSTGVVSGTPTAAYATANVVFSVKDANNVVASTTSTVSFTVSSSSSGSGTLTVTNAPASVGGSFVASFVGITGTGNTRGIAWGEGIVGINGQTGEFLIVTFDITSTLVTSALFYRVEPLAPTGAGWGCTSTSAITVNRSAGTAMFNNAVCVPIVGNTLSTQSITLNGNLTFTPF